MFCDLFNIFFAFTKWVGVGQNVRRLKFSQKLPVSVGDDTQWWMIFHSHLLLYE